MHAPPTRLAGPPPAGVKCALALDGSRRCRGGRLGSGRNVLSTMYTDYSRPSPRTGSGTHHGHTVAYDTARTCVRVYLFRLGSPRSERSPLASGLTEVSRPCGRLSPARRSGRTAGRRTPAGRPAPIHTARERDHTPTHRGRLTHTPTAPLGSREGREPSRTHIKYRIHRISMV